MAIRTKQKHVRAAAREPVPVFRGDVALPDDPTIRAFYNQSHRPDTGVAFIPDPENGTPISAQDAESFAEEFIATATTGEGVEMDAIDEISDEEDGGPFLEIESEAEIQEAFGLDTPDGLDRPSPKRARRVVRRA